MFRQWLHHASNNNNNFTMISSLFKDFSFMPLRILNTGNGENHTSATMMKAIQKDVRILTLANKNGYGNFVEGFIDASSESPLRITGELLKR